MHAARNYRGTAWVAYDRLYRCQAAARRSLDWAIEDSTLYNEAFVGQAKFIARCRNCLSEHHGSDSCPEFPQRPTAYVVRESFQPSVSVSLASGGEVCRKFNDNRCTYAACKYKHVCLKCGHPHPAVFCISGNQRGYQPRDRSPQGVRRNRPVLSAGTAAATQSKN